MSTLLLTARARGWLVPTALAATAIVVAVLSADVEALVPLADGPRRVRQYLVAFAPVLCCTTLVDRWPAVSSTLPLERAARTADVAWALVLMAAVGVAALGPLPLSTERAYGAVSGMLLAAVCLVAARRWGTRGVVVGCFFAGLWLTFGNSVAPLLGFPDLDFRAQDSADSPALPLALSGTVTTAAAVWAVMNAPRR